jgi:hypothetical protein
LSFADSHLRTADAGFKSQELIGLWMRLKSNVAANGDRHQRHLQVAAAPADRTVTYIFLRRPFNVERLRLWPDVFDPVNWAAHD